MTLWITLEEAFQRAFLPWLPIPETEWGTLKQPLADVNRCQFAAVAEMQNHGIQIGHIENAEFNRRDSINVDISET